jgi:N6-L-threonylcarbamoyladenine synthase
MIHSKDLKFSFSGLKTAFLYKLRDMPESEQPDRLRDLASSFQEAVFDTLLSKLDFAMRQTGIVRVALGGGVSANVRLRMRMRQMIKRHNGQLFAPPYKYLYGDNAAMIGVAAHYRATQGIFAQSDEELDRVARLSLV